MDGISTCIMIAVYVVVCRGTMKDRCGCSVCGPIIVLSSRQGSRIVRGSVTTLHHKNVGQVLSHKQPEAYYLYENIASLSHRKHDVFVARPTLRDF
jgi:hypothetical protein